MDWMVFPKPISSAKMQLRLRGRQIPGLGTAEGRRRWGRGGGHLRVVPVEGQPVEAFQLVLPECVAVPVFSGALQFLPVCRKRPILHGRRYDGLLHRRRGVRDIVDGATEKLTIS